MSKYGHRTGNWHEAIVNKLGGEEAADRFLRDELGVSEPDRAWREQDGVIYFTVISDGKTGLEWIAHLEAKGDRVGGYAKQLLCSGNFQPTSGVVYEITVLKSMIFNDKDRVTKKIRTEADKRRLIIPNAEIACLIRDKFTDHEIKAMGLVWIVTMHEPIRDSDGILSLLAVSRSGDGRWLIAYYDDFDRRWDHDNGFAFVLSQV